MPTRILTHGITFITSANLEPLVIFFPLPVVPFTRTSANFSISSTTRWLYDQPSGSRVSENLATFTISCVKLSATYSVHQCAAISTITSGIAIGWTGLNRNMGQSPTWGNPAPQDRLERQCRGLKFCSQQRHVANAGYLYTLGEWKYCPKYSFPENSFRVSQHACR